MTKYYFIIEAKKKKKKKPMEGDLTPMFLTYTEEVASSSFGFTYLVI